MQLRRGPPEVRPIDARMPPLRLLKDPRPVRTPQGWRRLVPFDSYSFRIVAGLLLVSVPFSILLGVVMANWSAQTSIDQSKARAEATAESAAVRINDWVDERQAELRHVAALQAGQLSSATLSQHLAAILVTEPAFESMQIFHLKEISVAASKPGLQLSPRPSGAPYANSLIAQTIAPLAIGTQGLDWLMSAPI